MKKLLLTAFSFAVATAFSQKQQVDFANKYAQDITPTGLNQKLSVIAGAEMEGRETATPGQRRAASYIESHFQKLGLLPGTSSGYQMLFPVYQDTLIEATLRVNGKMHKLDSTFSLDIASAANGTYDINEIVFASYGIVDS